jgi:hypothetical protein
MENEFSTTNINIRWLENIYENLKNLEGMERVTREGCSSLIEFLQIPQEHQGFVIPIAQYKSLRIMATEIKLLLDDLTPVMDVEKLKDYRRQINNIMGFNENGDCILDNQDMFIREVRKNNQVSYYEITPFFNKTLNFISAIKAGIIKDIGHILYIKEEDIHKKKW